MQVPKISCRVVLRFKKLQDRFRAGLLKEDFECGQIGPNGRPGLH